MILTSQGQYRILRGNIIDAPAVIMSDGTQIKMERIDRTRGWDQKKAERFARPVPRSPESIHAVLARRITSDWEPDTDHKVFLDIGTGPGRLPVEVKALFPQARVIGIDPMEYMVGIARQNADKAGFKDIEILRGSAEEIPVDSESVDLVMAQFSLLFWEEPRQGFTEIYRVLKPDGTLAIYDWNKSYPGWKFYLQNFNRMLRAGWNRAKDARRSFRQAYRFEETLELIRKGSFEPVLSEGKNQLRFFIKAVKVSIR